MEGPRAWFAAPADGDTVAAGGVRVVVSVDGVKLVPATGVRVDGEGHLHFFLDRDVTRAGVPIPNDPNIVHVGTGATEHVFSSISPGWHRIITVFAFGDHAPDTTVRSDTIRIFVKERPPPQ